MVYSFIMEFKDKQDALVILNAVQLQCTGRIFHMGLFKKDPKKIWDQAMSLLKQGNTHEGIQMLKKAAEAGYGRAWLRLGEQCENEAGRQILKFDDTHEARQQYTQAADYYYKAIQAGFPYGWKALGDLYGENKLENSDVYKALRCYERAAEAGIPSAKMEVARMNLTGITMPKDAQTAIYWYESAWKDNRPDAYVRIGELYEKGDGVKQDIEKAFSYYEKAAACDVSDLPDSTAFLISNARLRCTCRKHPERLGYFDLINAGQAEYNAKNYRLACELWERAAAFIGEDLTIKDPPEKQTQMTSGSDKKINKNLYYYAKQQVELQDKQTDIHTTEKSEQTTKRDEAWAAYDEAWVYRKKYQETSLPSDREKMLEYYIKASNLKHHSAQAELGKIYFFGLFGMEKDIEKASDYLYMAARADHTEAQGDLALLSFIEKYGKRNPEKAFYWSRRSAKAGNAEGQFVYAFLCGSGEVSKADEQEALKWIKKSAEQGYEPAIEQLKRLE